MATRCIVYIATSTDGYIADEDGGVDWLPHPEDPDDSLGYQALMQSIDSIIMGRKSYEQICTFGEWAWPEKQSIVCTQKKLPSMHPSIVFRGDSPTDILSCLEGTVWLLGGAELIHSFAKLQLIDQYIVTVVPNTYLKKGIPLFLPNVAPSSTHDCVGGLSQYQYSMR